MVSIDDLRAFVDDLRREWKLMWHCRVDDKVRAEGIADKTYDRLFVDRGTILFATRDFKPPDFQEILEKHMSLEEAERVNPDLHRGGMGKFIREYIIPQKRPRSGRVEQAAVELDNAKKRQQLKHCGRGWLHLAMEKRDLDKEKRAKPKKS